VCGVRESVPGAGLRAGEPAAPSDGHRGPDPRPRQLPDAADQAEGPRSGGQDQVEGGRD